MFLMLAFLIGLASMTESYAQPGQRNLISVYGNLADTVTNTATKYMYVSAQIRSMIPEVTAVINIEKLTGTIGGTITIEASTANTSTTVSWYSYYLGIVTPAIVTSTYTFTATDLANQSFRFKLDNFRDSFIRIKYTGTGTMSAKITGTILY